MEYDNLDLDFEMKRLVAEHAWWIVLRSFDITSHSQYWNFEKGQAIGGPAWKYNDIMFRGRRVELPAYNAEDWTARSQLVDVPSVAFFVISNIRPKKEDQLIEINDEAKFAAKPSRIVKPFEVFRIQHVESKIDNKLIFSKCYCSKLTPQNDATLSGAIRVNTYNIRYL